MQYIRIMFCLWCLYFSFVYSDTTSVSGLVNSSESQPPVEDFFSPGPVRLLIARPNSYGYSSNAQTMWVSSLAEAFLYFRLNAVDKLKIIPLEQVMPKVSKHRDFEKRISKSKYLNAGKELYATHVLYSEFEVRSNEATFYFTIESLNKAEKMLEKIQASIDLGNMNKSLNKAIGKIAEVLGVSKSGMPEDFFDIDIMGTKKQSAKLLGTSILGEKSDKKALILKGATGCEKVKELDSKMYLAYFVAGRLYARAGKYEKTVELTQILIEVMGKAYPQLHLLLAYYYQEMNELNKAEKEISRLSSFKNLEYDFLLAKGVLYEMKGEMNRAIRSFENLLPLDGRNPGIYLHLAKISMVLRRQDQTHQYVSKAARLSGKPEGMIYFAIGEEFAKAKNFTYAADAYRKCIDLMPNNGKAWQALGDIQVESGEEEKAAVSYLHLFNLDYLKYEKYLEIAGTLFEKLGLIEKAQQAYINAFGKYSDPKIAILLATLEFKQGNYEKTKVLLEPLGAPWNNDPKVKDMLLKSDRDRNAPIITLKGLNPMIIDAGERYTEPGATARDDQDGDLTNQIKIMGTVNVTHIDTYTVTYSVEDKARNVTKETREVIVIDTLPPVIKMIGGTTVNVIMGKKYKEPGAVAKDNIDGDVTSKIETSGVVHTKSPGVYVVTYTVSDSRGNQAIAERLVNVRKPAKVTDDHTPPVITLTGGSPTTINQGEYFEEPSVNAVDDVDGDVTGYINIEGEVNSKKPGKYSVVYSVTDRSGNKATKILTVKVKKVKGEEETYTNQLVNVGQRERTYRRKKIVSVTTGLLGAGSLLCGLVTNYMLIPDRQRDYDNAEEDWQQKKTVLQQTETLRDVLYGGAVVFAIGFTLDIIIPWPKRDKE